MRKGETTPGFTSVWGRIKAAMISPRALFILALALLGTPLAVGSTDNAPAPAQPLETLAAPPILPNRSPLPNTVEVDLTAAPARLSLLPGRTSSFYAYNGRIPGPTLEVREGDHVIVHFRNNLPEATTIHWHGLHVPVVSDGNPMDPVPPGGTYDYVFDIQPGMAGTYWYHPHPHLQTGKQIARGLYGAIIVRAAEDPLPPLPEKLLILTDARVNGAGGMVFPTSNAEEGGWEGNTFFVNGQIRPTIALRSGEVQRWRIINASVARFYRIALNGQTMLQVGTDGGLFEHPVERGEILLPPAQRVEVLVRGSGEPETQTILQSLPYDRYRIDLRPTGWDRTLDLASVQYSSDPPTTSPVIPSSLRPVPALDPAAATATQTLVLREAVINGKFFDPNRVDITTRLNATEIWTIQNLDAQDHPFHLHGFSFQVLDRNGVPEPFRAWMDTVDVPKHSTVRIIVEYRDYPGRRMYHCHIVDHEDYGMMGVLEVLPDPTTVQ
jgi:FtsP/CotA-like multicopper oxidase with cupredoxin domain